MLKLIILSMHALSQMLKLESVLSALDNYLFNLFHLLLLILFIAAIVIIAALYFLYGYC